MTKANSLQYSEIMEEHSIKMKTEESKNMIKKRTLGWDHFLVRGKEKVSGENALIMFTYNFKRLLNLIGIVLFKKLLIALKDGNLQDIKEEIALYITNNMQYMIFIFKKYLIYRFRNNYLIYLEK